MIERLRSRTGKMVIQYIMVALLGAMALSTVMSPIFDWLTGKGKEHMLMSIDGHEITRHELEMQATMYQQQIEYIKQQFGNQAQMFLQMLGFDRPPQQMALDNLIQSTLLQAAAENAGITTFSRQTLEQRISDQEFALQHLYPMITPDMYNKLGKLDTAALEAQLQQLGMGYDDLLAHVQKALQSKLYRDMIKTAFYVPDSTLYAAYLQEHVPRTFAYMQLSITPYLEEARNQGVSEEALQEFYTNESKKGRYYEPERRSGTYWTFDPADYGISISEESIATYYERHKQEYIKTPEQVEVHHIFLSAEHENQEEVKERAEKIAQELQAHPNQFAETAKRVSDADDASQGGYIGYIEHKDPRYPRDFTRAAFKLEDAGVSDPIAVENGFEIIGRVGKKPAEYQPREEVADDIRDKLRKSRFTSLFKTEARAARKADEVQTFIEQHNGSRGSIELVSQDNAESTYQKALYNIQEPGSYSIGLDDNTGYIVKLEEVQKRYLPELDTIRDRVREDYFHKQAYEAMEQDIAEAYRAYESGTSMQDLADMYNASVTSITITGKDDQQWSDLEAKGLPTQRMQHMIHTGYGVHHVERETACLVVLSQVADVDEDAFVNKKQELHDKLYESHQNQYTQAYINSLYQNAENRDTIYYGKAYDSIKRK